MHLSSRRWYLCHVRPNCINDFSYHCSHSYRLISRWKLAPRGLDNPYLSLHTSCALYRLDPTQPLTLHRSPASNPLPPGLKSHTPPPPAPSHPLAPFSNGPPYRIVLESKAVEPVRQQCRLGAYPSAGPQQSRVESTPLMTWWNFSFAVSWWVSGPISPRSSIGVATRACVRSRGFGRRGGGGGFGGGVREGREGRGGGIVGLAGCWRWVGAGLNGELGKRGGVVPPFCGLR